METALGNIRQNPFLLWFLVAFVVLWGGGMVWCGVLVARSLGKRRSARRALRSMGFDNTGGRRERLEQVKGVALDTLCRGLAAKVDPYPRSERLHVEVRADTVRFSYHLPEAEHRRLPRAVGVREAVQVVGRDLVLRRILFEPESGAFYAETTDTETVRAQKPARRTRSATGWVLCFAGQTGCLSTVTVYKRLTGHRGLLVDLAFKVAGIRPAAPEGLLPEFANTFETLVSDVSPAGQPVDEHVQRTILACESGLSEGLQLHINPAGVWATAEEWQDEERMRQVAGLCETLARGRAGG